MVMSISPSLLINLSLDMERICKQSTAEVLESPFVKFGSILTIQGAIE